MSCAYLMNEKLIADARNAALNAPDITDLAACQRYADQLFTMIIELCDALQAAQPRWISIEERLPDADTDVWFITNNKDDGVLKTIRGIIKFAQFLLTFFIRKNLVKKCYFIEILII